MIALALLLAAFDASVDASVDASFDASVDASVDATFDATAPLDIGGPAPRSSSCAGCHVSEAAEWARSRHRSSATNALFLDGFADEPHARCAYCHAPLAEQSRDLLEARRAIVARAGPLAALAALAATSSVHEGISCVTCHVRDGEVIGTRAAPGYAHLVRAAPPRGPALSEPAFCATCHEFDAHEIVDGKTTVMTGVVLQSTFSEWRRYAAAGGLGTCQSCHMPKGADGTPSHAFVRGAHDVAALREALVVDVAGASGARWATFSSRDVGHSYPSGDLFRALTVEVDGVELARFGKRFELFVGDDGLPHKRLALDTSLVPGERRRLRLPRGARRLTVSYHYADDAAEERGALPYDELVVTLVDLAVSR